nr:macrophage mannose receptor 1-like [Misgurnus anguillicaudatus]
MVKHQQGAVTAVMNMSLFLLPGLLCSASGLQRPYHFRNENMTWTDAQSYCRERYTDLATVDSMDDVNWMVNTVNDGYSGTVWIGLQRAPQSHWIWSNVESTISQYSNWFFNQPDGELLNEFCVLTINGFWQDVKCNKVLYFVCYNEMTGYIMINSYKNWTDAQSYCREYHTDLATVHSDAEQIQLTAVAGFLESVWIGLYSDAWQWSDQWSLFFRNWATEYTSRTTGFGDCVAMSTVSEKWVQSPCNELHHFICYGDVKKQTVRMKLTLDGKYNLHDPSLQTAILNKIIEKLKIAGLNSRSTIRWRADDSGEVFHPESKSTSNSNTCDSN